MIVDNKWAYNYETDARGCKGFDRGACGIDSESAFHEAVKRWENI